MNEFFAQADPWQLISTLIAPVAGMIGFFLHRLVARADADSNHIRAILESVGQLKAARERAIQADQEQRDWIDALDADVRELAERVARIEERERR